MLYWISLVENMNGDDNGGLFVALATTVKDANLFMEVDRYAVKVQQ